MRICQTIITTAIVAIATPADTVTAMIIVLFADEVEFGVLLVAVDTSAGMVVSQFAVAVCVVIESAVNEIESFVAVSLETSANEVELISTFAVFADWNFGLVV